MQVPDQALQVETLRMKSSESSKNESVDVHRKKKPGGWPMMATVTNTLEKEWRKKKRSDIQNIAI